MINLRKVEHIGPVPTEWDEEGEPTNYEYKLVVRLDWSNGVKQYGIDKHLEPEDGFKERDLKPMVAALSDRIEQDLGEVEEGILMEMPNGVKAERLRVEI